MSLRRCLPALAVVVLLALAGCTPARTPAATWWSGMTGALLRNCVAGTGSTTVANLETRRLGWRFSTATASLTGGWGSPPVIAQPGPSDVRDLRAISRVARCMDRYPIDWSLALDDTATTRARLYPWYRDVLVPCMARIGFDGLRMPSQRTFLAAPFDRYDPYTSVLINGPDQALIIQARCPPAPPDVIAQVRFAASSGSR